MIQSTNHPLLIHFTFRILHRMAMSSHIFFFSICYALNVCVTRTPQKKFVCYNPNPKVMVLEVGLQEGDQVLRIEL